MTIAPIARIQRDPLPCPDCEEGWREVSRYGGNDPDTWRVRCDTCEGDGLARCNENRCHEYARHAWIVPHGDAMAGTGVDYILLCDDHHDEYVRAQAEEQAAEEREP